jgi:tyrosyl-tRNA synthetase
MDEKIAHLLERNVSQVIVKDELQKKLASGEQLRIYLGVDPSGPNIHLGHAVALRKLAEFQKLGHKVFLLIGDFTAQIGDPTGKTSMRVPLTHEEVLKNAETYKAQASKILDFDNADNPAELVFNSTWLSDFSFDDVIRLAGQFTVQQMLERDMFQDRIREEKPISLHEFLYPLMQGYDTVALEADVEIGGTDQTFNMLAGRTLRKNLKNQEKHVLTVPLLIGTDGRKMSKSYHNTIDIDAEPFDQFGKIMSMKDDLILDYYRSCTDFTEDEILHIKSQLESDVNPRDIKLGLAHIIVSMYHSSDAADTAQQEFIKVFSEKEKPSDIPQITAPQNSYTLLDLAHLCAPEKSRGEIKRLITQGAVKIDTEKITDHQKEITLSHNPLLLTIGKRLFFEITA